MWVHSNEKVTTELQEGALYQVDLRYGNFEQTKHMGRTEKGQVLSYVKESQICRLDNTGSYTLNTQNYLFWLKVALNFSISRFLMILSSTS